ncbi:IclR family transcriptional regulator domain-containing protein [Enterovirga rhinocerotis]|uniref:IclR family transcriptional regulator n=1 Tax=Enterovirga rhinocerotis TaxID=1339210 RepID=A0A4V3DXX2_9HYPH|nr:IclR family transcriptional regulator C-terminal domain-containing protein [Enterovirga rhinocerotis]TDR90379.1 IclR family transcriptional regulator [Enterovirga rhinocerotis]
MERSTNPPRSTERDPEFVEALARGLNVIGAFNRDRRRMTLSEVAKHTDLSRGTARRLLHTLRALNFVDTDGRLFWLTPKVLNFGDAYTATLGLGDPARTALQEVTETLGESSSIAVLEGGEVVYVARVEVRRLYSSGIHVGTRLPAHCSSLGRVLLASLEDREIADWLDRHPLTKRTPRTVTDPALLIEKLQEVRQQEFAMIDGELEVGIRSMAVPVLGRTGRIVAALNASTSTARGSLDVMRKKFLPVLRAASRKISQSLE